MEFRAVTRLTTQRYLQYGWPNLSSHTHTTVVTIAGNEPAEPAQQIALIWFRLTDFASWAEWVPRTSAAVTLDAGAIGRGTRFRLETSFGSELWQVSYWDAGKRVIFQVHTDRRRWACAIETRKGESGQVEVVLEFEFEVSGLRRGISPLSKWLDRRRARSFADALSAWLQSAGL